MREPSRIYRILDLLLEVWSNDPDLRLGQLLVSLTKWPDEDLFYLEDDVLERRLKILKETGSIEQAMEG